MIVFFSFIVVSLVLFYLYVRFLEKKTAFAPEINISATPNDVDLKYEDVYLQVDGFIIHGWWVPCEGAQRTLLYLHGNAGNISDRVDKIRVYHDLGFNFFIIDYRGYGLSEGKPSEEGLYTDAQVAYNYLIKDQGIVGGEIFLCGASLGSAVAIDLATKVEIKALILDSAFSSALDIGRDIYPFIPGFMIKLKFNSIDKIAYVKVPKLFLHSVTDDVILIKFGVKLYDAAPGPKEFVRMKGDHVASHRDDSEKFRKTIKLFLQGMGL
ncbi:MAG: fermentation-respiration switch protein FrsA (DUF1100 family) [Lysobacterales bacterium]|jgi:fermentation-respiration switch protein FrsA (DUF1100 family)